MRIAQLERFIPKTFTSRLVVLVVAGSAALWTYKVLSASDVVASMGAWDIVKYRDTLTQAEICMARDRDDSSVRLYPEGLFIAAANLREYAFRFDDDAVSAPQIVTPDADSGDIGFDPPLLQRALKSSRLRITAKLGNTEKNYDLDLTGIGQAYQQLTSGTCP